MSFDYGVDVPQVFLIRETMNNPGAAREMKKTTTTTTRKKMEEEKTKKEEAEEQERWRSRNIEAV